MVKFQVMPPKNEIIQTSSDPKECFNRLTSQNNKDFLNKSRRRNQLLIDNYNVLPEYLSYVLEQAGVVHIVKANLLSDNPEFPRLFQAMNAIEFMEGNYIPHLWLYKKSGIKEDEKYLEKDYISLCEHLLDKIDNERLSSSDFDNYSQYIRSVFKKISNLDNPAAPSQARQVLIDQMNLMIYSIPNSTDRIMNRCGNDIFKNKLNSIFHVNFAFTNTLVEAFVDPKHPSHQSAKNWMEFFETSLDNDPEVIFEANLFWGINTRVRELYGQGPEQIDFLRQEYQYPNSVKLPDMIFTNLNSYRIFTSYDFGKISEAFTLESSDHPVSGNDVKDKIQWIINNNNDFLFEIWNSNTEIPDFTIPPDLSVNIEFADENLIRIDYNLADHPNVYSFSVYYDVSGEKVIALPVVIDEDEVSPEAIDWSIKFLNFIVEGSLINQQNDRNTKYVPTSERKSQRQFTSDSKTKSTSRPQKPNIPAKWRQPKNKAIAQEKTEAAQLRRLPLQVPETIESQIRTDFGKSGDDVKKIVFDKIRMYKEGGSNLEKHAHKTLNVENMYKIRAGDYRIIIEKKTDDQGNNYLEVVQVTQGNTGDYHREFH